MKRTTVNDIHQLAFLPNAFPVNCYFVEEAQTLTLIDTALPFSANGILKAAAAIGKPITNIVLTHAHDDHVGALDTLKSRLPDARVYISKRDARLLEGDRSLEPGETLPIRGGVPKNVTTRADEFIEEGDAIGSLVVIATPGHTPGSMSFFDPRHHALIVGDTFQTRGGVAVSGHLQLTFPFPALATWNREEALESAKKLLEWKPELLAVGHGKMIMAPLETMNKAIENAEAVFANSGKKG
ncbi:Glyoxylase, beta-lactamase superfamily II [Evansella caseinilytica]|uniref:Glyoxylase, beta-lactamase superfamily II n=1 Tax=Evansella caseinilytica TaxID=1503961 RepID=A0A1H3NZX9_9BACI|nr:MBL fold metallo-hydrolase [Evansella caseinilytica]SDY94340.1 Glyoxylase, beta-lactamase superfamily II [Evansella caseinilytica]